ncbi:MAG TPA: YgjV family protein [Anaeromyxobacter sp.]|nr:YgjV family protein [Anaeromyxobacter sp.]
MLLAWSMHLPSPAHLLSPAQLVGYLAFVLGVTAFSQREDRRLKVFLTLECLAYVVHFVLLGNATAATSSGVSGCRTLLTLRFRSRRLALVFMATYLAVGALLARTPAAWLPAVGSCLATWALFTLNGVRMRLIMLVSTSLWLANNILSGSVGGTLLEALIATSTIATMVRMVRAPQEGRPGDGLRGERGSPSPIR